MKKGVKRSPPGPYQKYFDPLKINIAPITITEMPARRSPNSLSRKDNRDAKKPAKKRAGTVPNPKRAIVRKPWNIFWEELAFMTIAQGSMHGRNPTERPRRYFDQSEGELMSRTAGNVTPDPDTGKSESRRNPEPRSIIINPAMRLTTPRAFFKYGIKPAIPTIRAAEAPRRAYVVTRPI
jgi:hypothetical protein